MTLHQLWEDKLCVLHNGVINAETRRMFNKKTKVLKKEKFFEMWKPSEKVNVTNIKFLSPV